MKSKQSGSRRTFMKTSGAALALSQLFPISMSAMNQKNTPPATDPNMLGPYGDWAAQLASDPPQLSYRNAEFVSLEDWKGSARQTAETYLSPPAMPTVPEVTVLQSLVYDGLKIDRLEWQLPYGPMTQAIFLRPNDGKQYPGILGLHDHGGNKYLGWRKIARMQDDIPDFLIKHYDKYYGGKCWANELAKRGYAVLVHDTFTFGSRKILPEEANIGWGMPEVPEAPVTDADPAKINQYNAWASMHEHIISKSLLSAGTTWPGVFLRDDQVALSILANHEDVSTDQLGCCGLSGGGLRSAYLGGMDERIKCAIPVGFMTTWRDLILAKCYTHTWMTYVPILPKYLDFPEILGLRAPLATLVLNNNQDQLFTLSEMKRADEILKEVFDKANAADSYKANFYDGPHKFDQEMQADAFAWFDQWLG